MSKRSSKRHRRHQLEQVDRKARTVAKHLSRPIDALPALPRLQVKEPFSLQELGLHRELCVGSVPRFQEGVIVLTGRR
jgi:hypothetical protein